jgi:hypothetical protein
MSINWAAVGALLTSTVSILSTSLLMGCFLFFKELQVMEFKMNFFMCLGDFITGISIATTIIWY